MGGGYKELAVWKEGLDFVVRIYEVTAKFPKDELYGLVSQMRRAAVSVVSSIAEGKGRTSKKELAHFLSTARGSMRELETQTILSARLKYISEDIEEELLATADHLSRMLAGLINYASAEM